MKKIDTLYLTGQNSINLFYNLFIPTKEYIQEVIEANRKISEGIIIISTEDDFIATINNLDLLFLDN